MRVRTVYRYFANKFAVIATVGEEMFKRWGDWNAGHFAVIGRPGGDWAMALREMIEGWIDRLASEKGARAILLALSAVPLLRDLDRAAYARLVADFEAAISRRVTVAGGTVRLLRRAAGGHRVGDPGSAAFENLFRRGLHLYRL